MVRSILTLGMSAFALAACDGDGPYLDDGDTGPVTRLTVSGEISQGRRCPLLTAEDGTVYSLAGADLVSSGSWYTVSGLQVEDSVCDEGDVALSVSTTEQIEAPGNGNEGEGALTETYLLGPWTHRGGDCARPDFAITITPGGGLTIETSLDGAPRTGFVRSGDDAAFVFDQPLREFPLEARRAEALAVLPPESGTMSLGGQTITGDGTVFIKCADEFVEPEMQ